MKKSTDLFGKLVEKIEIIQETQQGNLKGGFTSLSTVSSFERVADNNCHNHCDRGCKVKEK
jgi:hypothetical protein